MSVTHSKLEKAFNTMDSVSTDPEKSYTFKIDLPGMASACLIYLFACSFSGFLYWAGNSSARLPIPASLIFFVVLIGGAIILYLYSKRTFTIRKDGLSIPSAMNFFGLLSLLKNTDVKKSEIKSINMEEIVKTSNFISSILSSIFPSFFSTVHLYITTSTGKSYPTTLFMKDRALFLKLLRERFSEKFSERVRDMFDMEVAEEDDEDDL